MKLNTRFKFYLVLISICFASCGTPQPNNQNLSERPSSTINPNEGTSSGKHFLDSEESRFLILINQYRIANGLGKLQASVALNQASSWMSHDMGNKNYFSHADSLSRDFSVRIKSFGYNYNTYSGENIAAGNDLADETFTQWKTSPGHNANMLNPQFKVIGISRVYVQSSTYQWYWTTDFGGFVDVTR